MLKARHEHIEGIHSILRLARRTGYLGHRHLRQALHTVPQGAKALPEAPQDGGHRVLLRQSQYLHLVAEIPSALDASQLQL